MSETDIETELTTTLPDELADLIAEGGLSELQRSKEVSFDPVGDANKLQTIIDLAYKRLLALDKLIIKSELEAESRKQVSVDRDGQIEPAILIDSEPTLEDQLKAEYLQSRIIAQYNNIIKQCMKDRRLLSGQLYGNRMANSSSVARMTRTRKIAMAGKILLESGKSKTLSPLDDVETITETTEVVYEHRTSSPFSKPKPNIINMKEDLRCDEYED